MITDIKSWDLVLSTDSNGDIDSTEVITIMHYGDVLGNPKYFIIINYILIIIFVLIESEFLEINKINKSGHSISLTHNHLIYEKTKGYLKAGFIKLEDEL